MNKKDIKVVGHSSFLGTSGFNDHSQNFFLRLNKTFPTRIRNYSYTKDVFNSYPKDVLDMIIESDWPDPPHKLGTPHEIDNEATTVNIVLNEVNHYYFWDDYPSPLIYYTTWETTKKPTDFFERLKVADQVWVPTQWERNCMIDQGFPEDNLRVVREGIDPNIYHPLSTSYERKMIKNGLCEKYNIPKDAFIFSIFGRWDHRKSIKEMVECFVKLFGNNENVYLTISADNPFSDDGLKSTEERLKHYNLECDNIRVLHFPPKEEYIHWLQTTDCYLSCSRSEGWNLPLIQALACGAPCTATACSGQMEYAHIMKHLLIPVTETPASDLFGYRDKHDIGNFYEPDFEELENRMQDLFSNYEDDNRSTFEEFSFYIRNEFKWENMVEVAIKNINELVEQVNTIPELPVTENDLKLNLGCGNDIRPGYVNIDKYNNTGRVDSQADMNDLPYEDETVDEIFTSHVFEHIPINEMYDTLTEWRRVLKVGGRLMLYLPDLEHEVNIWLNTKDEDKWLNVERIFGSQTHPGNTHFCGFNIGSLKSFLESFDFHVADIKTGNRGFGNEIQCKAIKMKSKELQPNHFYCHFVDGPMVDIQGDPKDKSYYQIDFFDQDNDSFVHSTTLKVNHWTRPFRKYYTNWLVKVRRNGIPVYEHKINLAGKNVLVSMDTKGIGDTIAFMPYVVKFQEKFECNVILSTFWNKLFNGHNTYKHIRFVEPGQVVEDLYASYNIGCYDGDYNKNKNNWRVVPLGKVAADTLGVEYDETIADLAIPPGERQINEKYVVISEFSTINSKHWHYPNGWQIIVDYLNDHGYKVAVTSKEETELKNVINRTNRPIEESITTIFHAECTITVSTGPAWLAWAMRRPVVMISGYSDDYAEFEKGCERIINKDVCHACFNDVNFPFDRGDWNWCKHKGTERQFECTKNITPEMVIKSLNKILKIEDE